MLVLSNVVHISIYRQRIYYVLCSLLYIDKYTITVIIIHNECIYSHLFIIITTIAITYYL